MFEQAVRDFLMLFATIDPVGSLAIFVAVTTAAAPAEKRRIAFRAVGYAAIVLIAFLIAGESVLGALGVRLVSFQLAGGVILFLIGLQMVFGTGVADETGGSAEPGHDVAVFPLALPAIASPGAIMAVVLLTDNHRQSFAQQALTGGVLLFVLALTLVLLLLAAPIYRFIGRTGANVLVRVIGLILAALATEQIVTAVEALVRG
jgi:multiple antibiotic resistance protein